MIKIKQFQKKVVEALNAQGFHARSLWKPLYNLPIFKNKIAFGRYGYPFNLSKEN